MPENVFASLALVQASQLRICDSQRGNGGGSFPNILVFPCQYHPTSTP